MIERTWTQGPWIANPQNVVKIDGFKINRIAISGGGLAIAAVWNGSPGKEFGHAVGVANARVVTVAPEAVDVCLELIMGDGSAESLQRAIDKAREVLTRMGAVGR